MRTLNAPVKTSDLLAERAETRGDGIKFDLLNGKRLVRRFVDEIIGPGQKEVQWLEKDETALLVSWRENVDASLFSQSAKDGPV